jgi:5-methylcytosine-specific restriction endonuclease McrA
MRQRYEIVQPGQPFDSAIYRIGAPCKRNHLWDEGITVRTIKNGHCTLCERIDALERQAKRRAADPENCKSKAAAYMQQHRAKHGRESRSKHGLPHGFLESNGFSNCQSCTVSKSLANGLTIEQIKERLLLDNYIRNAGRLPSIARLVYDQQQEHWRQYPDDKRKHAKERSAYMYVFRYMCDPVFRRHECQRNSERKAKNRGNHTVRLNSNATAERFAHFDNSCAYCGDTTNLIVEHFIPRSKGGPHALGNLLPACQPCNVSKRDHDPEHWYREQPFYIKARWRKILAVLGKTKTPVHQLPLL